MSSADAMPAESNDIRPVVPTGNASNWGLWAFGAIILLGGFMVFNALSASREAAEAPSVLVPDGTPQGRITAPPPIALPDRFLRPEREAPREITQPAAPPVQVRAIAPSQPIFQPVPPSAFVPRPDIAPDPTPAPIPTGPQVVFERSNNTAPASPQAEQIAEADRVKAGRFTNPSRTIPQGTVIPAVLETALDSTRPGGVRALVQRDIFGFDGTRLLIPRGSRLYGEYDANLQPGQNRAQVQWTRLIRPDGVTIALDSPSSDPLGRAGIRGKVDSKFLQRFGGALLQSVLDIGVGIAVNEASDGVIVALPGSTQNVQVTDQRAIQPTLKVKHGTSVSVFVARDLDFSTVEP